MRFKSALKKDHLALVQGFTDTIQRWDGEADEGEGRWVNSYIIDIVSKTFSEVSDNVYQVEIELKRSDLGDLLSEGDDQTTADKINDAGYRYKGADFTVDDVVALREELQEISFGMVRGNSEQVASVPKGLLHTPHGETKLKANIKLEDTDTPDKAKFKVGKDSAEFTFIETLTQSGDDLRSVAFSPDGDYLAFGGLDNNVYIIQTSDWTEIGDSPFTQSGNNVWSVAFSPDGEYLVIGSQDSNVYIIQTSDWTEISNSPLTQSGDRVLSVAFSPDGEYLAFGSLDNNVYVIQTSDWTEIGDSPFTQSSQTLQSVAFSPDGEYLAFGGHDNNVYIIQTSDWTEISNSPLTQSGETVLSVAFSPDGGYLAFGGSDNNVYIIQTSDWTEIGDSPLTQSGETVLSVAFSPDGGYLAFGGSDNNVYIIQTSDWTEISDSPLTQSGDSVRSVAFSPNGGYLAFGGDDDSVYIFETGLSEQPKEILINAAVGQISGSVSDTATNIPLATQTQADTWTDFPVRATCYNAAKSFLEAVEDGDIEVVVIYAKDGQDLLVSERAAEPIGGQQAAKSMDADWQIVATNSAIATQKAIDKVFVFGTYPDSLSDSELEVLADSQQVMEDVADRANAVGRIMESPYVVDIVFDNESAAEIIAGSETAMNFIVDNETALQTVVNSQSAMGAVAGSGTAMDIVADSQLARDTIGTEGMGFDIIAASNMAIGKYVAGSAGLDPSDYADMDAVAGSESAMGAVVDSQVAMDAVVGSETAMDIVADSQLARDMIGTEGLAFDTIAASNMAIGKYVAGSAGLDPSDYPDMDAVVASQSAMNAVADSQDAMNSVIGSELAMNSVADSAIAITIVLASTNLDWSSLTKGQGNNILASANSFTADGSEWTEVDDGIGDGGWDRSDVQARYGDDMSNDWGASNYPDTPSGIATVLGFSPQGSDQGQSTIGWVMDLTNVSQMDFWYMHQNGFSSRPQEIIVNGDTVFNNTDDADWTEANIDLSGYSGDCTVEFGFGSGLSSDFSYRWCAFTGIKLTKD